MLLGDFSDDLLALENVLGVDVPGSLNKIRYITEKVLHHLCTTKSISGAMANRPLS